MEVKVKASVIKQLDSYDYKENYCIKYTYKVKGFKKDTNYINIIYKKSGEPTSAYDQRIIKILGSTTKEDVIEAVKDSILKNLMYRVATSTAEQEKKRLLKELNNIKFNFKVKQRL